MHAVSPLSSVDVHVLPISLLYPSNLLLVASPVLLSLQQWLVVLLSFFSLFFELSWLADDWWRVSGREMREEGEDGYVLASRAPKDDV